MPGFFVSARHDPDLRVWHIAPRSIVHQHGRDVFRNTIGTIWPACLLANMPVAEMHPHRRANAAATRRSAFPVIDSSYPQQRVALRLALARHPSRPIETHRVYDIARNSLCVEKKKCGIA